MQPAILIVDDEPNLLRLLVRVLERDGYSVHATGESSEACTILDAGDPPMAALVLDAGIASDVLARVGELAPGIGVVLVSGDLLPVDLALWIDRRGGRFLRKPFRPAALVDAVRSAVDQARAADR